jgi:hypothetical protein
MDVSAGEVTDCLLTMKQQFGSCSLIIRHILSKVFRGYLVGIVGDDLSKFANDPRMNRDFDNDSHGNRDFVDCGRRFVDYFAGEFDEPFAELGFEQLGLDHEGVVIQPNLAK